VTYLRKFSPVEEIASKFARADYQNFCRLASKKSAESAVFLGLEGTLLMNKAMGFITKLLEKQFKASP